MINVKIFYMKFIYNLILFITLPVLSNSIIYTSAYIDVENSRINTDYSITIEDKLITSIDKGFISLPENFILIDLRGLTLIPGLMDMHVHLGQEYQSKSERPIKI